MTVVYIGEQGVSNPRSGKNTAGVNTYVRKFTLETTAQSDDPYDVGSHASLPSIGDAHPSDSDAYCREIIVDNSSPWKGWTVTCNYSSERQLSSNPDNDEILISWRSEMYQIAVFQDKDGEAILNSAGDMYVDPPLKDVSRFIATIKSNHQTVPAWVLSYQGAINNASITVGGLTIPQYKARFEGLTIGERQYRSSTVYYPVTFEIHIDPDGWLFEPLDAGFRHLKDVDGPSSTGALQLSDVLNPGDQKKPDDPVLLDGSGGILADPSPSNAVYNEHHIQPELDFSVLPGIS